MDKCEMCGYLEYDDEEECYSCGRDLDEDEMYNFLSGEVRECPYFTADDEYKIVRHQM